jgi:hypothetical protein
MVLSGAQLDSVAKGVSGISRAWWETDDSVRDRVDCALLERTMPPPRQEPLRNRPYWLLRRLY